MEYDQITNLERLTGEAHFTPTGEASSIKIGNIRVHKVDYGIDRKQYMRSRDGKSTLRREDSIAAKPILSLTCDEWASPVTPLVLLGDQLTDLSQSSGATVSFTFSSKKGRNFKVPALNITNVIVTVPSGKTEGADFTLDKKRGYIYIMLEGTIADATSVTLTFDKPAITREKYQAFTKLNRTGTMFVYESDEYSDEPKAVWTLIGQLTSDNRGEVKVDDATAFDLRFAITADVLIDKRKLT